MRLALLNLSRRLGKQCRGATAVEYGLIVAMIVIAMVSALQMVASTNSNLWNNVSDRVQSAH